MSPSILFVTQRYSPSLRATAQLVTDLATGLSIRGYNVSVLCETNTAGARRREELDGVAIHRIPILGLGRASTARRAVDALAFYAGALRMLLQGRRFDVVIFLTAPPFVTFLGYIGWLLRRQRYIVWSHDLHPEAEIVEGILRKRGALARLLRRVDSRSYHRAEFIVDLGECMKRRILARGIPPGRCVSIRVWSRPEDVAPIPPASNPMRRQLGLEGRFVVMYSGNAGIAHRFDETLAVMRRLRDDSHVFFVFIGDGVRRTEIERFVRQHRIKNFRYLDYFPREQIRYSLSLADVHLITLRTDMAGIAVPSKLSGVMGIGRPVVMIGPSDCEVSLAIHEAECGLVIEPSAGNAVDRLELAIRRLAADPGARERYGANGRRYFLQKLTVEAGVRQWNELLQARLFRDDSSRSPREAVRVGPGNTHCAPRSAPAKPLSSYSDSDRSGL